jgi:hypothetical protein
VGVFPMQQINKRIIRFGNMALVGLLIIMLMFFILKMINFAEIKVPVKAGNSGMNITYLYEYLIENSN